MNCEWPGSVATRSLPAMSMRAWVKPLGTTLGVAAVAGAAQLGIAYGIAILLWAKDFTDPGEGAWAANLTWVCWLAAASVVLGVVIGRRVTPPIEFPRSVLAQFATVASAAVGALVTVPLVGIPARYAELAGDSAPASTAARIALVGVLLGAVVSVGVLLGRPLEWNTLATTGVLWAVAFGSVLVSLGRGEPPDSVRLAVWSYAETPGWFAVMAPMLVAALAVGAGLALLAKRQGHSRVAVAVCGAPGPLVVAIAYLVAGPGSRPETGEQFLPYLAVPYAVLTGLLGSLLVAAIERPEPDAEPAGLSDSDRTPVAAIAAGPAASGDTSVTETPELSPPDTEPAEPPRPGVNLPDPGVPGWHMDAPTGESPESTRAMWSTHALSSAGSARELSEPAWEPSASTQEPSGPAREPDEAAAEPPVTAQGELDEDEAWLRQIRGDDRPHSSRPAPEPGSTRRRKWSLFSEDAVNEEESAGDQR